MDQAAATPRALRCIVSFVGRRNAGKSSLINAFTEQEVAIVSEQAGTTTDAVAKPYELLPLGPVTVYDTAGIDDGGDLGKLRIEATYKVLARSDIAVLVCGDAGIGQPEVSTIERLQNMKIPFVIAFNKSDIYQLKPNDRTFCESNNISYVTVSAAKKLDIDKLKQAIIRIAPPEIKENAQAASDLFDNRNTILLVVPIDLSAPKGRLILPQVQILREILDNDATGIVCKEDALQSTLEKLQNKPDLVITDSQAIKQVAEIVPESVDLTTFSIIFARNKGDLKTMVAGAHQIDNLRDGDKILIAEACSHHTFGDDIGQVKIPNLIRRYSGKNILFDFCGGHDFPDNLEEYSLVVHCGACMLNRIEMLRRLNECVRRGVPITNYGVIISKTQGILERVIKPFNL